MRNCNDYQEMISRLLDEELSSEEAQALHTHIADCDECRRLYDAFAMISAELADDTVEPPEELAPGIMFKVRAAAAATQKKKRFKIGRYAAMAACLAVVILAAAQSGILRSGAAKEAAQMKPYAVDMESVRFAMEDSAPIPVPEDAYAEEISLDALSDDADYGYTDRSESANYESYNGVITEEADTGLSFEPEAPQEPEAEAQSFFDTHGILLYQQSEYKLNAVVDALPENAVRVGSVGELFDGAAENRDAAVYALDNALYIRVDAQSFALYLK